MSLGKQVDYVFLSYNTRNNRGGVSPPVGAAKSIVGSWSIYIDVITFNLMYDLLVFMCADVNGAISCYLLYNIFKATPLSLFYMLETGL